MTAVQRKWSLLGAVVVTGVLLTGCTAPGSDSTDDADGSGSENTATNSLNCDWGTPAVTSDAAVDPGVQEGELSEILVGGWQRTGFDIGAGYQTYNSDTNDGNRDYRFVFSADGEYVDCQSSPNSDQDETRGDFTLEEGVLDLGDDGKYSPLTWNADTMTWRSQTSGALIYLQRR